MHAGKGQKSTEDERGLTLPLCYLQNFISPTDQVYEELLRCESHSPTPYELQQQFDSAEKNPFLAQRPTIPGQVLRQEAPIEQPQRQNPVQHLPSETLPTVLPSVLPDSTPQNEEDGFLPDLVVLGGGSDNLSGPDIDSLLPTTLGATGGELVKSGENFNYSDDFTSESINSNSTYASDSTYQVMCICILVLPGFFFKDGTSLTTSIQPLKSPKHISTITLITWYLIHFLFNLSGLNTADNGQDRANHC